MQKCTICFSDNPNCKSKCNHYFCKSCILTWLNIKLLAIGCPFNFLVDEKSKEKENTFHYFSCILIQAVELVRIEEDAGGSFLAQHQFQPPTKHCCRQFVVAQKDAVVLCFGKNCLKTQGNDQKS